jgi:hypothetical protein
MGCSLLRAAGFSCSLDVLDPKKREKILAVFFSSIFGPWIRIRFQIRIQLKCWIRIRIHESGSTTLELAKELISTLRKTVSY